MITFLLLLILCLLIFKNSLYFTMSLLMISISTVCFLAFNSYCSSLTSLMLVIIYVGAMMILISYICAITPNMLLEPDYSNIYFMMTLLLASFIMESFFTLNLDLSSQPLIDYFYSFSGLSFFLIIIFMLLFTLLMVTSQFYSPRGPFRSIKK